MNVILTSAEDRKLNETFSKNSNFKFYCHWHDIGLKFLRVDSCYEFEDSNAMGSYLVFCKIINEKKFKFACVVAGISPKLVNVRTP